jgi:exopolyphosphatase/guanosine-5'-triphosphate,3'-diphosphate pyrophosphatase
LFRVATNGARVAEQLAADFDWDINVISGETEARLSYLGAITSLRQGPAKRTVIDVGGGSTEVVHGSGERVHFLRSYPVGAVGLSTKYGLTQPADEEVAVNVGAELAAVLDEDDLNARAASECTIFVGGTATTLAAVSRRLKEFDPGEISGVEFSVGWLKQIGRRLLAMSVPEREELMPFDTERAPIIVGGCLIIEQLMNRLGIDEAVISSRGLRWGLLKEKFSLRLVS